MLGSAATLDKPAVVCSDRSWSWREVHAAAVRLGERFSARSTIVNLCDSRLGFLITWLAALRSGALQVLPPSGGTADLVAMLTHSAAPCIVADDEASLQDGWRERADVIALRRDGVVDGHAAIDAAALAWSPDWDVERVRLYTSGSTGEPEAQRKTLGQLVRGAEMLGRRLRMLGSNVLDDASQVVCSVPPQHMFGVEASVMLSLVYGVPVLDRRPLLPADVVASFAGSAGAIWITTPLHLQSLVRSNQRLHNCRLIIASTMPLAQQTAVEAERLAGAPVIEIYGSTETGALATRRTAAGERWQPLIGVHVQAGPDGAIVSGLHFASPRQLADDVAVDDAGGFDLLGRRADVIKIGGRRASLSGLNQILQQLPGLDDGVFFLPDGDGNTNRLVLIHAGAALDAAAVRQWLRSRIDAAFLPRATIRVDHLPRAGAGKIPRAALERIYSEWRSLQKPR